MLKIARVQVFLVDDSEPKSREPDVMVGGHPQNDILNVQDVGCWF